MNFLQFASMHGLIIDNLVIGKIARCKTVGHRSKKNGAYFYDVDYGFVQDWSIHDSPQIWITDKEVDQKQLQVRIRSSQDKHKQERSRINQEAIKKTESILSMCKNNLSVYLARKGFPDMCFSMYEKEGEEPLLCVPMRIDGNLSGLQMIKPDGSKKFLYGTNASYATFDIGQDKQVFLCEGLASGLSLQKILNALKIKYTIRVCFSAGNMAKIARKHNNAIICCDNDTSGTGQKVGIESGLRYYVPELIGEDINDEMNRIGIFTISQKIKKILYTNL